MASKTQDGIRTAFQAEVYDPDGTIPGTIRELPDIPSKMPLCSDFLTLFTGE
jgi:hypothetical protein